MERPGRPSRHKSSTVKLPVPPGFSSDSDSELNDNDPVQVQVTYFQHPTDSPSASGGPSTSTATQPANQSDSETSNNNMMRVSPMPLRVTISPIAIPLGDDELRAAEPPPPEPARRKRSASILSSSVILDNMDTIMGSNTTTSRAPGSPLERFQHSDYVIRPRSFCNSEYSNAIPSRPTSYKIKRTIGPIDLTPSATTSKDSSCQAPAVTSSFNFEPRITLRDTSTLTTNTEPQLNNFYNSRPSGIPFVIPQRTLSMDQPSTSSSILRQFDEMRSTSPPYMVRRRPRAMHSVRFFNEGRLTVGSHHNEQVNNTPSTNRNASLVDYCDLVGNFLFNHYPSSVGCSENPRSVPERTATTETSQTGSTADIINRHINPSSSEVLNEATSLINDINCYLDPPEPNRNDIDGGEALEQSNDDVIMVETPERPPQPGSPDPDIVPSSRSPSPARFSSTPTPVATTAHAPDTATEKAQSSCSGDVPMTLCELNQTLISLLECPVCLDHATPPIFQCCKGHILCQSCHPRLTTCPICRSRLPGDRNSAMEKVAEKLMYPCKNTVTGCSLMLKLDDKQRHEDGCGFRHYACIVTSCHWKGYKPELVVHLQSNHPERLLSGTTQEVNVPLTVPGGGSMFIACHWLQSAHNEVFNVIFHVDLYKRIMKGCVIYIGSPDRADKFTYLFELKQRVSPFRTLAYSRMTHADTHKPGQPLTLSNDFSINIDMARLYRPEDCSAHILPVFVSVLQRE